MKLRSPVFILILAVVVLLILAPVAWFVAFRSTAKGAMLREEALWEELGGVTNLARLAPEPLPRDENAAVLWRQSLAMLRLASDTFPHFDHDDYATWDRDPQNADPEELAEYLLHFDAVFEPALLAARRRQCVWGTDYSNGLAGITDSSAKTIQCQPSGRGYLRDIADLLLGRAVFMAHHGRESEALEAFEAVLALSDHNVVDPLVHELLTSVLMDRQTLNVYEAVFRHRDVPDSRVLDRLTGKDYRALHKAVSLGDGAAALTSFDEYCRDAYWPGSPWYYRDRAFLIRALRLRATRLEIMREGKESVVTDAEWEGQSEYVQNFAPVGTHRLALWAEQHVTLLVAAHRLRTLKQQQGGSYPRELSEEFRHGLPNHTADNLQYTPCDDGFVIWFNDSAGQPNPRSIWHWDCDELPQEFQDVEKLR